MKPNTPNYIEKNSLKDPSEDFDLLVSKGVELLQKLTGNTWTDYNYHDPGVTILEQLCFAFTDLSYRTGFDIKDILSDENGEISRVKNSFFDKKKILTTNAVTVNDYRKVILDEIEEVDNVDIIPILSNYSVSHVKGFYEMRVKLKDYLASELKDDAVFISKIENKIRQTFVPKRNLCEDLNSRIVILKPQTVTIQAEIIIKEFVQPEEVLFSIFKKIQEFFSPQLKFYSEKELLKRGMRMEEIYEGPLLKHGFMPNSELMPIESEIDVFKLISEVSSDKGVLMVQSLVINGLNQKELGQTFVLDKNSFPVLSALDFVDSIKLYTGDYKLSVSKNDFLTLLNKNNALKLFENRISRHTPDEEYISGGEYRNLGEYVSIQENFPSIYGLGKFGVYSHEGAERKAGVKQLRAYIFFFEQVLANYLAQLENISNFFSTELDGEGLHSFYFKPLYDIRGANEILASSANKDEWEAFVKNESNEYITSLKDKQESDSNYRLRKYKTFEHLYARFNERFSNFPINAYINCYGDIKGSKSGLLLNWKANLVKNFAETEYYRVHAFDYLHGNFSLGGFEKKMLRLLYIPDERKKRLTEIFENGKVVVVPSKVNKSNEAESEAVNDTVKWNTEKSEITSDANQIVQSDETNKLMEGEIFQKESFSFFKEGISILKYGVNYENYRIGRSPHNENEFIIIYRKPNQEKWRIISHHQDREAAKLALDKLINYLLKLSCESEGFHMVEHILLCPPLGSDSFGFRFCINKDEAELKNHSWTSFAEREEILKELVESVTEKNDVQTEDIEQKKVYKDALLIQEAKRLKVDLNIFLNNKTKVYPRFEMLTRNSSGKTISEDFYNMRVTVVLPSWPARFQDLEFRSFTENLFKSSAPAHLGIHFLWLGIERMKEFENSYFEWLNALRTGVNLDSVSEKVAKLVDSDKYVISPY